MAKTFPTSSRVGKALDPFRIVYTGDASSPTGDELLQAGVGVTKRAIEQISIQMENPDAIIRLARPEYAVIQRFELKGGRFGFSSQSELRLHCFLTFERGDGKFADEVDPGDGLVFPSADFAGSCTDNGANDLIAGGEGINLEYTNEGAIDTGLEWPANGEAFNPDGDLVLNVDVMNTDTVSLADGSTYRTNSDFSIVDDAALDLNGQNLEMRAVEGQGPTAMGLLVQPRSLTPLTKASSHSSAVTKRTCRTQALMTMKSRSCLPSRTMWK